MVGSFIRNTHHYSIDNLPNDGIVKSHVKLDVKDSCHGTELCTCH